MGGPGVRGAILGEAAYLIRDREGPENAKGGVKMSPLWRWRSWVLVLLLVGPVLAYVGLGMLWLWERGWVACTLAAVAWLLTGGVFSILAARWTKTSRPLLPPLDWDSPQLFSPLDRDAWKLVQDEAEKGDNLSFDVLLGSDTYIKTGRNLFRRIASHYHPFATEPLDDVPLVELMTALSWRRKTFPACAGKFRAAT